MFCSLNATNFCKCIVEIIPLGCILARLGKTSAHVDVDPSITQTSLISN